MVEKINKIKQQHMGKRDWIPPVTMLAPALIILIVILLIPSFYNIYLSFQNHYIPDAKSFFIGFENYVKLVKDQRFWNALRNTAIFLILGISIQTVLGFLIALLLSKLKSGANIFRAFILVPVVLTPIVVGFMWRIMYSPTLGIFNYFLSLLRIPHQLWIYSEAQALISVTIVDIWQWTPFMMLIILAGLLSIPNEVIEAAKVDGANTWQMIRYIKIPLVKPFLGIALLFRTIDAGKLFDTIYIMTRGGPGTATETLSLYTYTTGFTFLRMGYAATIGMMLFFIIVFITQMILRWSKLEVG